MTPLLSICIIGKNEERCINRCLQAISGLNLPIVYTDTGSTDRTIEIASKYTDLIYHFDWCNDFSKARNFCAMQAPTDWIWFMDCDEYVLRADKKELQSFCAHPDNQTRIGTIQQRDTFTMSGSGEQTVATTRLGRIYNKNHCRYSGAVHEQITPISSGTAVYHDLSVLLEHDGYLSPELFQKKCLRNIELMQESLRKEEDPYLYYQLGKAYSSVNRKKEAVEAFQKGLSFDIDPQLYYVQSMVEAYGYCLLDLKEYEAALSFENIYDAFAVNADFVFLMGLIYMNNAMFDDAIAQFQKATEFATCTVDGANSYRAFYNIGVIYECTGRTKQALAAYEKCGNYAPALSRKEVL